MCFFYSETDSYSYRYIDISEIYTSYIQTHFLMTCKIYFSWLIALSRTSSAILNCDVVSGHSYFSQRSILLDLTEKHIDFVLNLVFHIVYLINLYSYFINSFLLFSLCILFFFQFFKCYTYFIHFTIFLFYNIKFMYYSGIF